MKKIYQIIVLCVIGIALASCGGRTDDTEHYKDSVDIALEDKDFVRAYRYASKCNMTENVASKEAVYVLEEQGEDGLVRISMIVNEHKAPGIYLDLLKMSISMNNEQLATKIYKMSDACDEQTIGYAVTADMEGLVNTFLSKNPDFIDKQNVIEYLKEKGTYDKLYLSVDKKRQELKAEMLREKLESVISKVHGTKPPKGLQDYHLGSEMLEGEYWVSNKSNVDYYASSQQLNTKLDQLLSEAIKNKNLQICNKIINSYAETIEITLGSSSTPIKIGGVRVDEYHCYIKYTYSAKNDAQKVLKEAIRNGSFK